MTTTIHDLRAWKTEGKRWVMLTAYDAPTAEILSAAGILSCWWVTRSRTTSSGSRTPCP